MSQTVIIVPGRMSYSFWILTGFHGFYEFFAVASHCRQPAD